MSFCIYMVCVYFQTVTTWVSTIVLESVLLDLLLKLTQLSSLSGVRNKKLLDIFRSIRIVHWRCLKTEKNIHVNNYD